MRIKHNDERNYIVSKARTCGKFKSNTLLEFFCTEKSERIFVFIITLMCIHRPFVLGTPILRNA